MTCDTHVTTVEQKVKKLLSGGGDELRGRVVELEGGEELVDGLEEEKDAPNEALIGRVLNLLQIVVWPLHCRKQSNTESNTKFNIAIITE